MRCEHAATTTLLWLYGEADESHVEHVAGCEACQSVAEEHAEVMSAMAGVSHLDLRAEAELEVQPANRGRFWPMVVGGAVVAALAVMFPRTPAIPEVDVADTEVSPVELAAIVALDDDPLDDSFDALSFELGDLMANVEGEAL